MANVWVVVIVSLLIIASMLLTGRLLIASYFKQKTQHIKDAIRIAREEGEK